MVVKKNQFPQWYMAKINSTVVKINFHGGKNHFFPLCHPQTSVPAILALILLVGIRGNYKTCLVGSSTWKMART